LVIGTVRDQIIYPDNLDPTKIPDNAELRRILSLAKLEYICNRFEFEDVAIWNSVLSLGEQQRLSFARLFYHSPPFAVLDESTSALDPENEDFMYIRCAELGIGLISVGHRESLVQYHNLMLIFDGQGGWKLLTSE